VIDRRYYVYAYLVDGIVRYIGKGSTCRIQQHMQIVRRIARQRASGQKVKAEYFHNKLCKAWLGGAVIEPRFIAEAMTEDEAYERERVEVQAAAKFQLWNQKSGGGQGVVYSTELRDRIRQAALKRYQDPKQRDLASVIASKHANSPEARAKRAVTQSKRFASGDPLMRKFNVSGHTQQVYKKRGETLSRTYVNRPDLVASTARKSAAWWANPENNAAMRSKLSEAHSRPEVKAKRRAYYDSPEGRANLRRAAEAGRLARAAKVPA
jgi:hypothetical protein